MNNKRRIATFVEIFTGTILMICDYMGIVDEYWSSMGVALFVVGIIQLIRQIKYQTNESYRDSVDIKINDERNKYIAMKSWAWAGYLFVMIAAAATIVLKIMGHDNLVPIASGSICLIMVLYWLSYIYLRRKY